MADFGKLNFSTSFNPTSAFPLDARCYFTDLASAEAAAASAGEVGSSNTVYYFGMKLFVDDGENAKWYTIQRDGTLQQEGIQNEELSEVIKPSETIKPSITGFIRYNSTVSPSANYLRTDYLSLLGYKSVEYNTWIMSSSDMATWSLYDGNKKWLYSSDDVYGDDYYNTSKTGKVLGFGYKRNTLSVCELLTQYPSAVYIVFSTGVLAGYQSYTGANENDVGWGSSNPYIRLLGDERYNSVLHDRTQDLTDEQKLQARSNIGILDTNRCKYVEEFKTSANNWDTAFSDLISYCTENGYIACAAGTYTLTNPLTIGNVNVNFENADIKNDTTTEACIILTGASQKTHKFGNITCKKGIGILVNTTDAKYEYNRLYANTIRGYVNSLAIVTTNYICSFNEFHAMRLRSSQIPLRVYSASQLTAWANECYFYLSAIEGYRDIRPTKLIELTNTTRCNFYNLDIEQPLANPDTDPAIELTNCRNIAFFNPRTAEPSNAVQFRFIGECFNNFVDAEYCKYATIDCSQMQQSDGNYNIFRGSVITTNSGDVTNCNTLRVYRDMIVPVTLTKLTRKVSKDLEINHNMIMSVFDFAGDGTSTAVYGVPTLYKWAAGNITVNKRFIALLPTTLQIIRISDSVGNILDEDGNVVVEGTNLDINKRYDINIDSYTYKLVDNEGEYYKRYKCFDTIILSIDKAVGQSLSQVFVIGPDEPENGPCLWFDTSHVVTSSAPYYLALDRPTDAADVSLGIDDGGYSVLNTTAPVSGDDGNSVIITVTN